MLWLHRAQFNRSIFLTGGLLLLTFAGVLRPSVGRAQDSAVEPVAETSADTSSQNPLIERLAEAISNTKWTGSFTIAGDEGDPKTETYEIKDAQYQGNDQWLLTARIAYGDRDITVPIPLEIKWAGKTPVITVDNLTIPPLGTFDARVLMRRGSYAGTWAHGDKGGHLFGVYKKTQPPATEGDGEKSP